MHITIVFRDLLSHLKVSKMSSFMTDSSEIKEVLPNMSCKVPKKM